MIPHITDEIKAYIMKVSNGVDLVIVEIGGTVGDIESLPFLEAIRQFRVDAGRENVLYVHLTLVPYMTGSGELKTKPTQHSVMRLREIGIQPDILICRSGQELSKEIKSKISLFCNVPVDCVVTAKDVNHIYDVPLMLHAEGLDEKIVEILGIWTKAPDLSSWEDLAKKIKAPASEVTIAIVGKYVHMTDSYKSLNEALQHGGYANDTKVNLKFVDAETLENDDGMKVLADVDGILVPGGFGERGVEGKIKAIGYARKTRSSTEYAWECNLPWWNLQEAYAAFQANSIEFDPSGSRNQPHGGTEGWPSSTRARPCAAPTLALSKGSFAFSAYGEREISNVTVTGMSSTISIEHTDRQRTEGRGQLPEGRSG